MGSGNRDIRDYSVNTDNISREEKELLYNTLLDNGQEIYEPTFLKSIHSYPKISYSGEYWSGTDDNYKILLSVDEFVKKFKVQKFNYCLSQK